jgi:hypothetical protein
MKDISHIQNLVALLGNAQGPIKPIMIQPFNFEYNIHDIWHAGKYLGATKSYGTISANIKQINNSPMALMNYQATVNMQDSTLQSRITSHFCFDMITEMPPRIFWTINDDSILERDALHPTGMSLFYINGVLKVIYLHNHVNELHVELFMDKKPEIPFTQVQKDVWKLS